MSKLPADSSGLAPYAIDAAASRGRRHAETPPADSSFELDRRRILHAAAFRRLLHKTQVFVTQESDHYRTRLTHTLEVVSAAQRIAAGLQLNVTLAGAVAMAHDLGHPPFGHAGEHALNELMQPFGGFEHNVQSLRVVDYLEHPYPAFRGLNLAFELREGLIKHNTPYDRPGRTQPADDEFGIGELIAAGPLPPLEAQVVDLADQIAYSLHDVEDGLMQGLLNEASLNDCRLWRDASAPLRTGWRDVPLLATRRPILDALGDRLCEDAIESSRRRIAAAGVTDADAVRHAGAALVCFSDDMRAGLTELQQLLSRQVYRHHSVVRMDAKAQRLIRELFNAYTREPQLMPPRFTERIEMQGVHRVACDYIAGMTDRYCRDECARLFDPQRWD